MWLSVHPDKKAPKNDKLNFLEYDANKTTCFALAKSMCGDVATPLASSSFLEYRANKMTGLQLTCCSALVEGLCVETATSLELTDAVCFIGVSGVALVSEGKATVKWYFGRLFSK